MIRRSLLALLVALSAAACSSAPAPAPSLVGQWTPVSAELGGKEFLVANFGGATLRLTKDTYEFGGDKGSYTVLSTSPPAKMDIRGMEGPNAGRTIQAIHELAGEQLTICYQLGPGDRPSAFTSAKGPQILLVHYQRVP